MEDYNLTSTVEGEASASISPEKEETKKKKGKKKKTNRSKDDDCARPNMFIAVQVSNPDIHARMKEFQSEVVSRSPAAYGALIPLPKSHVTMMALKADPKRTDDVLKAMRKASMVMRGKHLTIAFRGVSNFGEKVFFTEPNTEESGLEILHAALVSELGKLEFVDFKLDDPVIMHLTMVKTSRHKHKAVKGKKLKLGVLAETTDRNFGTQIVTEIQLLSLSLKPPEGKDYYASFGSVPFSGKQPSPGESLNHENCCGTKIPSPSHEVLAQLGLSKKIKGHDKKKEKNLESRPSKHKKFNEEHFGGEVDPPMIDEQSSGVFARTMIICAAIVVSFLIVRKNLH